MTRRFGSSVVVVAVALSLFTIIPGSASANPLAARAKAAAAQKLTDQVMKTVDPKISEIVAKAPLTPDFKAEIEMKLSASARDIVKREIDGAAGGRLPNPTALANKVINEVGRLAENLIASALDRAASGAGVAAVAPVGAVSGSYGSASGSVQSAPIPRREKLRLVIAPFNHVGQSNEVKDTTVTETEDEPTVVDAEVGTKDMDALAPILRTIIVNTGKYTVLPPHAKEIREALDNLAAQKMDYTDEDRVKAIGAAVSTDHVLLAETRRIGNLNMLTTQIFNAEDGGMIAGETLNFRNIEDGAEGLRQVVNKLIDRVNMHVPPPAPAPVMEAATLTVVAPARDERAIHAAYDAEFDDVIHDKSVNKYWYFTPRWNMLGAFAGYGWWAFALELGRSFDNGAFVGVDLGGGYGEDGGVKKSTEGIMLNIGGAIISEPHVRLSLGGSIGVWGMDKEREKYYTRCNHYDFWGNCTNTSSGYEYEYEKQVGILGPFIRLSIYNVELSYRLLIGLGNFPPTNHLMLGYQFRWGR